ncbi:MAG: terminase small subunit protein [Burkholderiaceae bacterium]
MTGRPSDYSSKLASTICERIAEGESLRQICADTGMPARSTVMRWINGHAEFRNQYALAREMQSELMADEIVGIADACLGDADSVHRARLRIDARKWLMAKLLPKKYGDRITQEHTGPNGGPVTVERIERTIVDPKR